MFTSRTAHQLTQRRDNGRKNFEKSSREYEDELLSYSFSPFPFISCTITTSPLLFRLSLRGEVYSKLIQLSRFTKMS